MQRCAPGLMQVIRGGYLRKHWGSDPLPLLRSAMSQAGAICDSVAASIHAHSHGDQVEADFKLKVVTMAGCLWEFCASFASASLLYSIQHAECLYAAAHYSMMFARMQRES